jgi:ATPase family AAA domain-containing protein 2
VRATFLSLLNELDPELPILLMVTHDGELDQVSEDIIDLFDEDDEEVFRTRPFSEQERRKFFFPVLLEKALKAPPIKKKANAQLEKLPVAPVTASRALSEAEKARIERKEEATLRELRIFLREILAKMARNKLFFYFTQPVDVEEVTDYLDIIKNPMDLETMMTKIDQHCYESAKDFLTDIEQICANALEYNPDRAPEGTLFDSKILLPVHGLNLSNFRQNNPPSSLYIARHGLRAHQGRNGHGFRGAVPRDIAQSEITPYQNESTRGTSFRGAFRP